MTPRAPEADVFVLDVAISLVLAVALPGARWWAGARAGEPVDARRRATSWTALAMLGWLGFTGAVAVAGLLDRWDSVPPPIMPMVAAAIVLVVAVARSEFGKRLANDLPLWLLVGYQVFRLPVEIMLHRAYEQGVIGVQMTWSGRNFDVVTALLALPLGLWLWRRGEQQPVPRAP
jgi:hypothetical protein